MNITFKGITHLTGFKSDRDAYIEQFEAKNEGISMHATTDSESVLLDKEDVAEICKTKFNLDLPDIFVKGNNEQIQEYAVKHPEIVTTIMNFANEVLSNANVLINNVFEYYEEKKAAGAKIKNLEV